MKTKLIRIFSAVLLLVSLFSFVAIAAETQTNGISLRFNLTCDGKNSVTVETGDIITVVYTLENASADEDYTISSFGNEIYFDDTFFEYMGNEYIEKEPCVGTAKLNTYSWGEKRVYFNGSHLNEKYYAAKQKIGSFKLKVKATSGYSVLTGKELGAYDNDGVSYDNTPKDLWVFIGKEPEETLYSITYMNGNTTFKKGQAPAGSLEVGEAPEAPDGYVFGGWKNGDTLYKPGDNFNVTGDTVFTAEWVKNDVKYTLSFNVNGGSKLSSVTVKENTVIKLSEYTTSRTGYTFKGWYTDSALTDKVTSITMTGDMTVYAKWEKNSGGNEGGGGSSGGTTTQYTLSFETNGGSSVASVTKNENAVIDLSAYTTTKAGHTFTGWYADAVLTQKITSVTMKASTTVYAGWKKDNGGEAEKTGTYTLTFETNGGSSVAAVTKDANTVIDLADYVTSKSGYIFKGWYTDAALTLKAETVTLTRDVTVYAKWKKESSGSGTGSGVTMYTLSFETNGGSAVASVLKIRNTTVDLSKYITQKDGYSFDGWHTDKELTQKVESVKITSDTVLYAKWAVGNNGKVPTPNYRPDIFTKYHYSYIVGREDGCIHPKSYLTRAEAAEIFYRLLNNEVKTEAQTTENAFVDVNKGDWFNTSVSTLAGIGVLKGRTSETFEPDAEITRAELTTIIARLSEASYDGENLFDDIAEHWAKDYINIAASIGWVYGDENGNFRPNDSITRAEVVTLVNRALNRQPQTVEDLWEGRIVPPDNTDENAWYYIAIEEAVNTHRYEMKMDGIHETWIGLSENPDWTKLED